MLPRRRRSLPLICRIEMSGFVAVMVALVFLFLGPTVARPDLPTNGVDLPHASNAASLNAALREDAIFIAVQSDGRIWLGDERVGTDDLSGRIRERLNHGAERKVYLKIDARARYGAACSALQAVQSAGIENIAILTHPRTSPSSPR